MIAIYKFIGHDGSMGLFRLNKYRLSVHTDAGSNKVYADIMLIDHPIQITGIAILPYVFCPYDSLELFKANWKEVTA